MDRMELSPFQSQSQEYSAPKGHTGVRRVFSSGQRRHPHAARRTSSPYRSMFLKLGICAGACALVLVLKWVDSLLTNQAVQSVDAAMNDEVDLDEMLGKLQFVELPGILSVFQAETQMEAPVHADSSYLIDDGRMAVFEGRSGADIICSAPGTVDQIAADSVLGQYVSVIQENELTVFYYGFAEVLVEKGQPVKKLDTLGTLQPDGILCLSIYENGRPQDPSEYLNISGG